MHQLFKHVYIRMYCENNVIAMKRLEYDGTIGIFLDHCALFNEACEEHTTANTTIYKLRKELFDFHPKESTNNWNSVNEIRDDATVNDKRKRKRKSKNSVAVDNDIVADERLRYLSAGFLTQLKLTNAVQMASDSVPLVRCWEQTHHCDFPTFHGANETSSFQTFLHAGQSYVIPPHCRFYNSNVLEMTKLLPQLADGFDLIVLDPPWRNKYIRRIKRVREQLAYPMLDNSQLHDLPIASLIHHSTLVAVWCTNSKQHQDALCNEFLSAWNLRLLHSLKWLKLNTLLQPIGAINTESRKQPFEMLYLACHRESDADFAIDIKRIELLLSIPSIVHSHKPPLLAWLKAQLPSKQPKCLEIFARYLQPDFTAIGLEVLKLMDRRLYTQIQINA